MLKKIVIGVLFVVGTILSGSELVKNGMPCAEIILGSQPSVAAQLGAEELRFHIEKMTGAKLPIAVKSSGKLIPIYVGESDFTRNQNLKNEDFKNQEYLIRVSKDHIILMGRDSADKRKVDYSKYTNLPDKWSEVGTLYAVYEFLEQLGFRWYMPGNLGIAFTPAKNLSVKEQEIRRTPSLLYRDYGHAVFPADFIGDTMSNPNKAVYSLPETKLYELRKRVGGKRIIINHSFYTWPKRFPDKKLWFAQGYGNSRTAQLCYTNPEVIKQVAEDARNFFDKKKKSQDLFSNSQDDFLSNIYPVVPGDDRSWCQCARCQALILPKATRGRGFSDNKATNYILGFVNEVAKELKKTHPDKFIGTLSYASYFYPPDKVKLEDNIVIFACVENLDPTNDIFKEWREKFPNIRMGAWQYYCQPTLRARAQQVRLFPGLNGRNVEKNFRMFEKGNLIGMFWEPPILFYSYRSAAMEMVEGHILWSLAFDRNRSGAQMFNEFFPLFFGPAEKPMKEFYTRIEDLYCGYVRKTGVIPNEIVSWKELGNKKVLNELEKLISEARKSAPASPYKERIDIFDRAILQYMKNGQGAFAKADILRSPSMQQSIAVKVSCAEPGNPEKVNWKDATNLILYGGMKAEPLKKNLSVKIAHDGTWFYMMCHEICDPSKLSREGNIFLTDAWEAFFAKQRSVPYNHTIASVTGGYEAYQHTAVAIDLLKLKQNVAVKLNKNSWTVYTAIPLEALVPGGIKPGEMLYFNIIRTAHAKSSGCWIPTFAGYLTPERFGQVWLEK